METVKTPIDGIRLIKIVEPKQPWLQGLVSVITLEHKGITLTFVVNNVDLEPFIKGNW